MKVNQSLMYPQRHQTTLFFCTYPSVVKANFIKWMAQPVRSTCLIYRKNLKHKTRRLQHSSVNQYSSPALVEC